MTLLAELWAPPAFAWVQPDLLGAVSAAGFASLGLSWFCFTAVIVFHSNAAPQGSGDLVPVSASGLALKGTIHLTQCCSQCKNCLPYLPNSLSFQSTAPRAPEQLFPHPPRLPSLSCSPRLPALLIPALWTPSSPNNPNLHPGLYYYIFII